MTTDPAILTMLDRIGAVILNSHVVYTSGRHGSSYVDLDALHPHPTEASIIYAHLAQRFVEAGVEVVVGPTINGVVVSQWIAYHLSELSGQPVLSVYAEEEGFLGQRVFRRGYGDLLHGRRVLIVEDVLRTGGTTRKIIQAVQAAAGKVAGVGTICNRGKATATSLGIPRFHALIEIPLEAWDEQQCPLCQRHVPIDARVGKGAHFLARQQARIKGEV